MMDFSLYLVTDRGLSRGRSNLDVVKAAVNGGVSCVQLREKKCSTREFIAEALKLKQLLAADLIPLIINDRVDVALVIDADGVHLGQSDMAIEDARKLLGPSKTIGVSAECLDDARDAQAAGADYIGISPVFSTSTKKDTAPPLGLDGVRAISRVVDIPLVGIGGIGVHNGAQVIQAGASGIAVVSAVVSAPCPETAARDLGKIVSRAQEGDLS